MTLKLHTETRWVLAIGLWLAASGAPAVAPEQPAPIYREGEVVVKYRQGFDAAPAQKLKAGMALRPMRTLMRGRAELLSLPPFTTTRQALAVLRADPAVEIAEPNYRRRSFQVTPDDPLYPQQWALPGMNLPAAWEATPLRTGSRNVVVAVIDDAVQVNHPDLRDNIVGGRDLVCDDDDPSPGSSADNHGTLVAGCVAARGNNGRGVAGVGWVTGLLPIRFAFDEDSLLAALDFAREHGASIINASFGGPGLSVLEQQAIADLATDDILFVAAAGNDDSNLDLAQLSFPANYDADNIVAAAAIEYNGSIASFSQHGPISVDVAAPGVSIYTTSINGHYQPGVSGTSFASPHTAGVAALVKAHVLPTPGWREIKARLIESGTLSTGNSKQRTIGGRIDAAAALDMAPRPALVIDSFTFTGGDGDGALDSSESLTASVRVRNLWMDATAVSATLAASDSAVSVDAATVALGDIGADGTAVAEFPVTVGTVNDHRYVTFTLTVAAAGGYNATRSYIAEIGDLDPGESVGQNFTNNVYDEFHAWHVDVGPAAPAAVQTLVVRTETHGVDVDLLMRHGTPPVYDITVGINPETEFGFFCTGTGDFCSDPDTLVSARADGTEMITVVDPEPGPWHLVVVNFKTGFTGYTVSATLENGDLRPDPFTLQDRTGITPNTVVTSNMVTITGITAPTYVTITGGEYSVDGAPFRSDETMVSNGANIRVRANPGFTYALAQLTVGGVTEAFSVNLPPAPSLQDNSGSCAAPRGGGGGNPPPALLLPLALAALRRLRK